MATGDHTRDGGKIHLPIQQLTQFADEFNEVLALNGFLYDAVEGMLAEQVDRYQHPPPGQTGLAIFLQQLRQREGRLKQQLQNIRS